MISEIQQTIGVDLDEVGLVDRPQILVIEDEIDTILLLKQVLRQAGFDVMSATCGDEALKKLIERHPDLILLDLMLPEMDGWELIDRIRNTLKVPIIILSALNGKDEIVRGLQDGVDDFITKPFHNAEIVERIRAVLRRTIKPKPINRLSFPSTGLLIDVVNQQVVLNGHNLDLTPKEFMILTLLASHAPSVVNYGVIANSVWRKDSPEIRNRTKYLIYLLRRKFEEASPGKNLILNFDRRGYKLLTE